MRASVWVCVCSYEQCKMWEKHRHYFWDFYLQFRKLSNDFLCPKHFWAAFFLFFFFCSSLFIHRALLSFHSPLEFDVDVFSTRISRLLFFFLSIYGYLICLEWRQRKCCLFFLLCFGLSSSQRKKFTFTFQSKWDVFFLRSSTHHYLLVYIFKFCISISHRFSFLHFFLLWCLFDWN